MAPAPASPRIAIRDWHIVLAAGAILAVLFSIHFRAPWRYAHDDNGAWTQAVASAHLRAGLDQTRGQDFFLRRDGGGLVPYLHHPPLYGLTVAGIYCLTGRSDPSVTRAIPAFFHLCSLVGLAFLARRLWPDSRGRRWVALLLFAIVPMSSFFGKMPFNEAMGLCWVIWALHFTATQRDRPSRGTLAAAGILWALACLTSWPAYAILSAVLALIAWEARTQTWPGARRTALILVAVGGGTAALVFGQIAWAARGQELTLFAAAEHWGAHRVSPGEIISRLGKALDMHRQYFANLPFLVYLLWIGGRLYEARKGTARVSPAHRFILAVSLGCMLWALVFLRAISIHAYGQFWFLPVEALAVGDASVSIAKHLRARPRLRLALAALFVAGTIASSAAILAYRYGKSGSYAQSASERYATTYWTTP